MKNNYFLSRIIEKIIKNFWRETNIELLVSLSVKNVISVYSCQIAIEM